MNFLVYSAGLCRPLKGCCQVLGGWRTTRNSEGFIISGRFTIPFLTSVEETTKFEGAFSVV